MTTHSVIYNSTKNLHHSLRPFPFSFKKTHLCSFKKHSQKAKSITLLFLLLKEVKYWVQGLLLKLIILWVIVEVQLFRCYRYPFKFGKSQFSPFWWWILVWWNHYPVLSPLDSCLFSRDSYNSQLTYLRSSLTFEWCLLFIAIHHCLHRG